MYPDDTAEESGYCPEIRTIGGLEQGEPVESSGTDCPPSGRMRIRQNPRKTTEILTRFELRRSLGGRYPAPPTVPCSVVPRNRSSTPSRLTNIHVDHAIPGAPGFPYRVLCPVMAAETTMPTQNTGELHAARRV